MSKRILLIFITLILTILGIFLCLRVWKIELSWLKRPTKLVSPLLMNSKTIGLNQWFPQDVLGVQTSAPRITAKAALFLDTKNGQILYSKNIHERLPIASLTKVMTVVIGLEYKSIDDEYTISQSAAATEPDKMWLIKGEKLKMEDLLYGIFLISANDAAETIAEQTVGDRGQFIKLMNDKAVQLGMKNSHFVNPTGLDEDFQSSYSSAYDLALLSRYATRRFPSLVQISSTEHMLLPITDNHQDYDLYSGINLLTTYPGVVGFKTGFTPQAGLTLITLVRKENKEVLGIILGSENRREEAKELLDYSFDKLGIR